MARWRKVPKEGKQKLAVRLRAGLGGRPAALKRAGARAMRMNARLMEGFIWVDPAVCDARTVRSWRAREAAHDRLPVHAPLWPFA